MHVGVKPRHDAELRAEVESLHDALRLPQRAARRPRRTAHASSPATATPAASTIPTAATCIPTNTRCGLGAAAARAGVRIHENSWVTKLERRAGRRRRQPRAHRVGHGARAPPAVRRQRVVRPPGARARAQAHGGRHVHRGHRAAGRRARARADHQQRGGRRHQLGARLFPPLGRSPPAVRRPRELLRASIRSIPRACCARASRACSRSSRSRASNTPGAATSTSR